MNKKTKHTYLMIALTIALITLTACPPEEDGEQQVQAQPEVYDIEDYWPFEIGNFWQFINVDGFSDGYQFTYEVLEDYSTKDLSAWSVVHKSYDANGSLFYEDTFYYVLRKDFLVFTKHKAAMIEMIQNPSGPIPTDLFVGLIAPRIVDGGQEPQQYDGPHYTLAGPPWPTSSSTWTAGNLTTRLATPKIMPSQHWRTASVTAAVNHLA